MNYNQRHKEFFGRFPKPEQETLQTLRIKKKPKTKGELLM